MTDNEQFFRRALSNDEQVFRAAMLRRDALRKLRLAVALIAGAAIVSVVNVPLALQAMHLINLPAILRAAFQ